MTAEVIISILYSYILVNVTNAFSNSMFFFNESDYLEGIRAKYQTKNR